LLSFRYQSDPSIENALGQALRPDQTHIRRAIG
jgi:hypothetical protein